MYHFNLLPSSYQKQCWHWVVGKQLTNAIIVLNIGLAAVIGLLFSWQKGFQKFSQPSTVTSAPVVETSDAQITQNLQKLNDRIIGLSRVQENHPDYLLLLQELAELYPNKLLLTSQQINYAEKSIQISGVAPTRQELLEFNTNLAASRFRAELLPLDLLTLSTNIPFDLQLTFD